MKFTTSKIIEVPYTAQNVRQQVEEAAEYLDKHPDIGAIFIDLDKVIIDA